MPTKPNADLDFNVQGGDLPVFTPFHYVGPDSRRPDEIVLGSLPELLDFLYRSMDPGDACIIRSPARPDHPHLDLLRSLIGKNKNFHLIIHREWDGEKEFVQEVEIYRIDYYDHVSYENF